MKITLIHPPLDDPTIPYHSTAYLTGQLRQNGFRDVVMRDLNVEFVNYCLEPGVIEAFYDEGERRLRAYTAGAGLRFQDQEQYYGLRVAPRVDCLELQNALRALRQSETFLDYGSYAANVNRLTAYFGYLGALSYPGDIDSFTLKTRGRFSTYNLSDLLSPDLAARACYPVVRFFEQRLADDPRIAATDLLGISIVYDHQLLYALHLARLFKQRWPEKYVVLGGTAISQLYKYLKDKSLMKMFFTICDGIVIGEGESAICQIAGCREKLSEAADFRNTITYNKKTDDLVLPALSFEDVAELAPPVYEHPWELYLSPVRGINYSPTRGCYWNRCTFCDYGLNADKSTSPWRERPVDQVIRDLKAAQADHDIRFVYLAVDVMAPGYLERFSDALIDSGVDIRWGAEVRLEKIFTPDRCHKLKRSGCIAMSFGMESGSQRILDLIDKGTKLEFMSETMKNFSSAGIAVQLMAFTDFPTETVADKTSTYKFIEDNSAYWAAGGIGQFLLTGTSLIAKNPAKFGVTVVDTQDADVARSIAYNVDSNGERVPARAEEADASFHESRTIFPPLLCRPWAGGTDTLHSMIYYSRYGIRFFKEHPLSAPASSSPGTREAILQCTLGINGTLNESPLELAEIFGNRELFAAYLREKTSIPAEPTYSGLFEWEQSVPAVAPCTTMTYWLVTPREAVKLSKPVYKVLSLADKQSLTIGQLLHGASQALTDTFIDYFCELQRKGLLFFISPGQSSWNRFAMPDERVVRTRDSESLRPFGKLG